MKHLNCNKHFHELNFYLGLFKMAVAILPDTILSTLNIKFIYQAKNYRMHASKKS